MANLLIVDLPQEDSSLSLSRNKTKDIVGGDKCVPVEIIINGDGTYDIVFRCTPS